MKRSENPATAVADRVRKGYPQYVNAIKSYMGPVPLGVTPMSREKADLTLAPMGPQEIVQLAMQNPVAAEQAAQRLNVMDARASAASQYSDIGPED